MFSPSLQVTGLRLKRRSILVFAGSRPSATMLQHKSRSVIIPSSLREDWSMTTGTDPISWSRRIFATFWALSSGVQHTGSGVMSSRIFIIFLLKYLDAYSLPHDQNGKYYCCTALDLSCWCIGFGCLPFVLNRASRPAFETI